MKRYDKDFSVRIFDAIIDGIKFLFGLSARKIPIRSYQALDSNFIKNKWQEITELVHLGGPSRFKQAVLEADKLMSYILRGMGYEGSMAEQLKHAKEKFSLDVYNKIWQAHKVRNEIVHQAEREILDHEAKDAVEKFRKGLIELGAL